VWAYNVLFLGTLDLCRLWSGNVWTQQSKWLLLRWLVLFCRHIIVAVCFDDFVLEFECRFVLSMKGMSERTIIVITFAMTTFVALEGWPRDIVLSSTPSSLGMTGFTWSESLMYPPWRSVLTWDSLARQLESWIYFRFLAYKVKYLSGACNERRMWITCW
jgi:hypothetical protein